MNAKPGTSKDAADKLVRNIHRKTRQTCSAEEISVSFWLACVATKASRCCVGGRVSPRACITAGRRNSWRLATNWGLGEEPDARNRRDPSELDTSCVCVVDRQGNAFSATPSDGAAGGPVVPGLGFVVSGPGAQNDLEPEAPPRVGPGRRPRLTPSRMLHAQIFMTDMSMKPAMDAVWREWLPEEDRPCRATIGIADLGEPTRLIEVVVTAARSDAA